MRIWPPTGSTHAGTDLKGISLKGNAVIGAKPAGELALLVAQLKQGETKLSQLALNLSGDISQHLLTLTMKGDPVAANLKLGGGVRGDHWRGALSELQLKTPLRRWDLSSPWALDLDLPRQRLAMGISASAPRGPASASRGVRSPLRRGLWSLP